MEFKKIAIASFVAAAFASTGAHAMTAAAAAPQTVPSNLFKTATQTVKNSQVFSITAAGTDVFLGRTTGFNVVITLTGAKFKVDGTAPVGGTAIGSAGGGSAWTVSKAGGGAGTSSITYSVQPIAGSIGITQGSLLNFAAGDITLDNTALGTTGGKVSVSIAFNDPVGGNTLATATSDLITAVDGVAYSAPNGTTTTRIDVGTNGSHGSKTYFSSTGGIKVLDTAVFEAGTFTLVPATAANCYGSTLGTLNCTNSGAGATDTWQFDAANDTVTVGVSGSVGLAAFTQTGASVFVTTAGSTCSAAVISVSGIIAAATAGSTTVNAFKPAAAGGSYTVCLSVPSTNTTTIAAQSLALNVALDFASTDVTDPSANSGTLNALAYNGTVRDVYFFNPASNTTQTSLLRVVNPSATSGLVTVSGVMDGGTASSGSVSFTLGAGKGVTLTSAELESGSSGNVTLSGALGTGTGKWHLTTTGEFSGMQVMSVTRDAGGSLSNMSSTVDGATVQTAN